MLGGDERFEARRPAWRWLPVGLLAAATAAALLAGVQDYLSLDALLAYRDRLQAYVAESEARALATVALAYVMVVALSIPGSVFLTLLSGFLFGWLRGGLLAVVCATIGAVLVFMIATTSLGDLLRRRAGPRVRGFADGFRRDAFSYLLVVRFLPVVPFWLVNLAAALFGVPLRTFALATMLGIVPLTFTFATAGAGLDDVIVAHRQMKQDCLAAGRADCDRTLGLADLLTVRIVVALGIVATLSIVPILLRRSRRNPLAGGEGDATGR